jgi:hypothetical protein
VDKVSAAVAGSVKASPLFGTAFGSMTDSAGHRDELLKGSGTYK